MRWLHTFEYAPISFFFDGVALPALKVRFFWGVELRFRYLASHKIFSIIDDFLCIHLLRVLEKLEKLEKLEILPYFPYLPYTP